MMRLKSHLIYCILFLSVILSGCSGDKQEIISFEGNGTAWSIKAEVKLPYNSKESEEKYFDVYFTCLEDEFPYNEYDTISFALGTTIASEVFTYGKDKGYIADLNYNNDIDRVVNIDDETFQVLFSMITLDYDVDLDNSDIFIQITVGEAEENIHLSQIN